MLQSEKKKKVPLYCEHSENNNCVCERKEKQEVLLTVLVDFLNSHNTRLGPNKWLLNLYSSNYLSKPLIRGYFTVTILPFAPGNSLV